MKRLQVTILDLTDKGPSQGVYGRIMNANLASIMPQVVGVWCEAAGHDVRFVCYTGSEDLQEILNQDTDILFVGAFTEAALMAYSISHLFRRKGAVTVLGGPHARCYPQDAARYFDYVLGFCDQALVEEVLAECRPHRPEGRCLSAKQQPRVLPGVRERWKFIEPTLAKAPTIKIVPMIGSLGCPYTCSFCIDARVDYQPLPFDQIREDLRFLRTKMRRPIVGWHDPNFGVRFDDYMSVIEDAVPPGGMEFIAESSLSILTEPHLKALRRNGFKGILPGVESWFSLGGKSKTGSHHGRAKVAQVADHMNMILRYIPYVQANFVLGLDCDEGSDPFDLTKEFLDRVPGVFPGFSLLTAFGQAAPINLDLQRDSRVLPFPFHFLNNNLAMNVRPRNYEWPEFYDHVTDLTRDAFSWPRILRRFRSNEGAIPKWMNFVRAVSSEGFGRARYHAGVRKMLDADRTVRRYFDGESTLLPSFYETRIRRDLGPFWHSLPEGSLYHDPNAYLRSQPPRLVELPAVGARPSARQTAVGGAVGD